jgi:diacylglycerol kinase family enzyme
LAYLADIFRKARDSKEVNFRVTVDGEINEAPAMILYVVNAAKNGAGINVIGNLSKIDDGLMDAFILNMNDLNTIAGFTDRVLNLDISNAGKYMRQGKEMTIETEPDQPIWTDGEYSGRTPISLKVLPAVLPIVVP